MLLFGTACGNGDIDVGPHLRDDRVGSCGLLLLHPRLRLRAGGRQNSEREF